MTFTVLARDPRSGLIGAATASKSLAAGNVVLGIEPRIGVVATQAWTNGALRRLMLAELEAGRSAEDAVARLPEWDARPELRQVAALPVAGPPAAWTGAENSEWAGHLSATNAVVAGNLLAGPAVLDAMIGTVASAPALDEDVIAPALFARHLVTTLAAGEARGGDARGRQSAAVLVATVRDSGDVRLDLRVDDHADPLTELERLVGLRAADLAASVSARRA
ncbi:DUF1028 domain-containing protein [Microbacterium sp.]|uniref:DUF1028 domain-containing protein n=1 Tax=Microbacterium sp. TaxID=51671 RepID=UPI003C71C39B